MTIRRADAADAPHIARVLREAFAEYEACYTRDAFAATTPASEEIRERLARGPSWVAVQEAVIVGTVSAVPGGATVYIRSMAITPEARGKAMGALLLTHVERFAVEMGAKSLSLSTTPFLLRAIRLYERFGFERSEEGPHDLYGTPLFTMVKPLLTTDESSRVAPAYQ